MKLINNVLSLSAALVILVGCGSSSSDIDDSDGDNGGQDVETNGNGSGDVFADYCEKINTVQGFAAMDGGVTGGADVGEGNYVISVSTGDELRDAVYWSSSPYQDKPLTVYVDDLITYENSGGNDIRIERSDVSIIGRSENAGFEGVGVDIRPNTSAGNGNIIIRNLTMRLVPQSVGTGDIISLNGGNGPVRNVWIDHNEFYNELAVDECPAADEDCNKDFYDELVSGTRDVGNVTISYNYLHDSWKTSLWGSSDDDEHHRTVTFHHNHWSDVNSRTPLYRFGELHVFNNYYRNITSTGVNVRMHAEARIEGNVFEDSQNPIVSAYSRELGYWDVEDNLFENISTSGSCQSSSPDCYGAEEESTTTYIPPYDYAAVLLPADEVKAYVLENAGAQTMGECLEFEALTDES